MISSFVLAAALAPLVLAQSSSPLVPSDISSGCSSYLDQLNSDSSLSTCLSSLQSATSAFSPTANATASSSDVQSALDQLCASTACPDSTIHSALSAFYAACTNELVTSPNEDVQVLYDSLYAIPATKDALCTKSNGTYCVITLASSASSSSSSRRDLVEETLVKRDDTQVVLKPNPTTYRSENIAFLRLQPSDPSSVLCSDCSKQVQAAWIAAMNAAPYAPGIASSPMLAGQPALYNATLAACGSNFFSDGSINNVAGGSLSGGVLGGSSAAAPGPRALSNAAGLLGALSVLAFTVL